MVIVNEDEKSVLMYLASLSKYNVPGIVEVNIDDLVKKFNMKEEDLIKVIESLEKKGVIKIVEAPSISGDLFDLISEIGRIKLKDINNSDLINRIIQKYSKTINDPILFEILVTPTETLRSRIFNRLNEDLGKLHKLDTQIRKKYKAKVFQKLREEYVGLFLEHLKYSYNVLKTLNDYVTKVNELYNMIENSVELSMARKEIEGSSSQIRERIVMDNIKLDDLKRGVSNIIYKVFPDFFRIKEDLNKSHPRVKQILKEQMELNDEIDLLMAKIEIEGKKPELVRSLKSLEDRINMLKAELKRYTIERLIIVPEKIREIENIKTNYMNIVAILNSNKVILDDELQLFNEFLRIMDALKNNLEVVGRW